MLLLPDRVRGSVVGLERDESSALIGELWRRADESAARYERGLCSGDLYVWDNLSTVHNNPAFPRALARSIWFLNSGCVEDIEAAAS
jgi:alpha-ketoglutarate-dependent taurine dioxygenase